MKKFLFLGVCLAALAAQPVRAQAGSAEVVVVRLEESIQRVYVSVTRADGKSEQLEFKSGPGNTGLDSSGQGYQKLLAGLYLQGYRLQSTFSSTLSEAADRTTLIFVKGQ